MWKLIRLNGLAKVEPDFQDSFPVTYTSKTVPVPVPAPYPAHFPVHIPHPNPVPHPAVEPTPVPTLPITPEIS
ncbi:cyclin-dependent kinase inhibitor 1C-like [Anopheles arabiensis]|uniref:cyclin-dependent kinase inhibitor 1C-like n=1 Tax=Anopheles arabiensis TaxID=7173 RepID=UPI001AAC7622|nr:cyclin-dependent kinase inhibitor 1C-like [Anopheles arabiensis]